MPTNEDIKIDKVKVLVYGPSGTYKTPFACTFPNPYIFDIDNGILSARLSGRPFTYDTYIDKDLKQPTAARNMEKKVSEFQRDCPYDTIVVDSLTTMAEIGMNQVLKTNMRAGGVPQQQDWLQQMNWIKNMVVTLLATGKNVVFTAHEQIDKDELTGIISKLPLVTGKLAQRLPIYFDEIYHSEASRKGKDVSYRLLTKGNTLLMARSKLGIMDEYIDADFEAIMSKIQETYGVLEDDSKEA
jgi:hypothetical protein